MRIDVLTLFPEMILQSVGHSMLKRAQDKGIGQRVSNRGSERGLSREDAFTAYVMDRLLHRLGRSRHRDMA